MSDAMSDAMSDRIVGTEGAESGMPAEVKGECSRVLADVWLFLDDEMDPERRAAVQRHLDDCSPCLAEAGLEAKLKALLRAKCGGDRAPEGLRHRLATTLSAMAVSESGTTVTVQRTTVTVERSS